MNAPQSSVITSAECLDVGTFHVLFLNAYNASKCFLKW